LGTQDLRSSNSAWEGVSMYSLQPHQSMSLTLNEEDIEAIARRVVTLIGAQLASPASPPPPAPPLGGEPGGIPHPAPKLAYTANELCEELSISRDTLYKLEISGRLNAVPGIRHKRYSRAAVDRLLEGGKADWKRR